MTLHGLGMVGLWFVAGMAGISLLLAEVRPSDAWHFVDRLRRDAHRRRAAAGGDARSAVSASGGISSIRCRSIPAAPGRRGRRRRCSRRSRSWAWAGRCGRAICSGPSRVATACPTRWVGSTSPAATRRKCRPIIIIATVSFIGVLAGLVAAVVILTLVAIEQLDGSFTNDALLIKNLTFYFGHMLVNITMYFGVAMVYEIMPAYTGQAVEDQPARRGVLEPRAAAGDVCLPASPLHGLRPAAVAAGGRPARRRISISVPAAVVTIFSTLALVSGSKTRWSLPSDRCSISASWDGRSAASRR